MRLVDEKCLFGFHFIPFVVIFNEKFDCKAFGGTVHSFQRIFYILKVLSFYCTCVVTIKALISAAVNGPLELSV